MKAHRGLPQALLDTCRQVPLNACLCGRAVMTREIVFASRVDERHDRGYFGMHPHGHYCIPMISAGVVVGVIMCYVPEGHVRSAEEERFLAAVADVLAGTVSRKQAEDSLRESEERFSLAVRGTDAGIWDWDLRTNRVYFSARWKSMLGYEEHEIADDYREWERLLHPDDRARALDTIQGISAAIPPSMSWNTGSVTKTAVTAGSSRGAPWSATRTSGHTGWSARIWTSPRRSRRWRRSWSTRPSCWRHNGYKNAFCPNRPRARPASKSPEPVIPPSSPGATTSTIFPWRTARMGLVVADVSGHGFAPALLMSAIQSHLRALVDVHADMDAILQRVNARLVERTEESQFVTLFFARIDPASRRLTYVNAGHPPGYRL